MRTRRSLKLLFAAITVAAAASGRARAASVSCAAGDVACLVNAINLANLGVLWAPNTIFLAAGTYHLTTVNTVGSEGADGLPPIRSHITIVGAGISATILQRDSGAPYFRILEVSGPGVLNVRSMTLQGNDSIAEPNLDQWGGLGLLNLGATNLTDVAVRGFVGMVGGAGIRNRGSLSLLRVLVESNGAVFNGYGMGGGILNDGWLRINRSTIRNNQSYFSGGGIATGIGAGGPAQPGSSATIISSSITNNHAGDGGGIAAEGSLTVTGSTIAGNDAENAGGIEVAGGTAQIKNCTIADNTVTAQGEYDTGGGGITIDGGAATMENTILARNSWNQFWVQPPVSTPWDCAGAITSLGHNIVGNAYGCTAPLQTSDILGDPGLGVFTDQIRAADGSPLGNGQIPLLAGSPAIDGGNYNSCPGADQLGYPPVDANLDCGQTCDIGAVEYAPVVNSWISLTGTKTTRGKGIKGYPKGTVTVTQRYTNNVLSIGYPVFVLSSLSSNAVLLNGDPPNTGGVGSRMTTNAGGDWIWAGAETVTLTWVFGLKSGSTATFTADAVGFPDYP
jgi:hypothetical protein